MSLFKRMTYMGLGALLVLALVIGGVAVFAQSGDGDDADPAVVQDDDALDSAAQDDNAQDDEDADDAEEAEDDLAPQTRPFRGDRGDGDLVDEEALLAEALGITVDELDAAQEEARLAAIDQALEEGQITEEQAEQLREGSARFGRGFHGFADKDALLAEALGISVEELDAAQAEVRAARLQAMVEAGALTQEQADLIAAQEAVESYIDQDGLAATIQDAYEAAIEAAMDDGAISRAQADQLLENLPTFGPFGFGGGRGHHGHGRGHGPDWGGTFSPDAGNGTAIESAFNA